MLSTTIRGRRHTLGRAAGILLLTPVALTAAAAFATGAHAATADNTDTAAQNTSTVSPQSDTSTPDPSASSQSSTTQDSSATSDSNTNTTSDTTTDTTSDTTSDASDPSPSATDTAEPAATCPTDGSDISGVSYVIAGHSYDSLTGNVQAGEQVTVHYTLADACTGDPFTLVAYKAPAATYDPATASSQKISQTDGPNSKPGAQSLTVTVPDCFYQVDFVRGSAVSTLSANQYSNEGRLLSHDNGGDQACDAPPPPTCPTDGTALTNVMYVIDGQSYPTLAGHVVSGKPVTVDFDLAPGCTDKELSLVSYTALGATYDPTTASSQKIADQDDKTFSAGTHDSLTVDVPNCFYQVDFIQGAPNPNLTENSYANAGVLIDHDNGGTASCDTTPTTPPDGPTPPTNTPVPPANPVPPTNNSTPVPPAAASNPAPQVLGESFVQAPVAPAAPAAPVAVEATTASLPFTGGSTQLLLEVGGALLLAGAVTTFGAARMRRSNR